MCRNCVAQISIWQCLAKAMGTLSKTISNQFDSEMMICVWQAHKFCTEKSFVCFLNNWFVGVLGSVLVSFLLSEWLHGLCFSHKSVINVRWFVVAIFKCQKEFHTHQNQKNSHENGDMDRNSDNYNHHIPDDILTLLPNRPPTNLLGYNTQLFECSISNTPVTA